jgi:methylated-DNA-[protein]-cysteine S-methyltransferase
VEDIHGHALFDTAIGVCGIAWGPLGVVAVQLPEPDRESTRRRLLKLAKACAASHAPPPLVQQAIAGIQVLLQGAPRDLRDIPLETRGLTPFQCRVYELARAIAPGSTRTYGELATDLGDVGLARAVGQALGHNPFAPVVPCHRVLAAGDRPGGFSASGGARTKLRMLAIEGAVAAGSLPLFPDA